MCRVFCVLLHFFRWEIDYKKIKYKEKIAKGNFGEVWLGSWLGSPVAIKTVIGSMAQDSEFIERFVLEIKLMSNLHHPNIVMPVPKRILLQYCCSAAAAAAATLYEPPCLEHLHWQCEALKLRVLDCPAPSINKKPKC